MKSHNSHTVLRNRSMSSACSYPLSAFAYLGAIANVSLTQVHPYSPVRLQVNYDATGGQYGTTTTLMYIADKPMSRFGAGTSTQECQEALEMNMYDPYRRYLGWTNFNDYTRGGCNGAYEIMRQQQEEAVVTTTTRAREYACAIGDITGKYGLLPPAPPTSSSRVTTRRTRTIEDSSINLCEIIGLPIVARNVYDRTVGCANIEQNGGGGNSTTTTNINTNNNNAQLVSRAVPYRADVDTQRWEEGVTTTSCSQPEAKCTSGHEIQQQRQNDPPIDLSLRIMSPIAKEVTRGAYPWLVYMGQCSGTLIAPTVVLTAAHCVKPHGPIHVNQVVYMGCHSMKDRVCQEARRIVQIWAHEKFTRVALKPEQTGDGMPRAANAYDVAVLILEKPTSRTLVATLATREDDPAYCESSASTVAGWGSDASGTPTETLNEVEVPVISRDRCEAKWGVGLIGPTMICAGFDDGGCDACQGDSGGPMFTSTRCTPPGTPPRVFGIVSWGSECNKAGRKPYGVYTSVASVRDWIASKMPPGDQLADLDERVLPYVVRAIDETESNHATCGFFDESWCRVNVVAQYCPKLCTGSCPLVKNE